MFLNYESTSFKEPNFIIINKNHANTDHTNLYTQSLEPNDKLIVFCKSHGDFKYGATEITHEQFKLEFIKLKKIGCKWAISERHHPSLFNTAKYRFRANDWKKNTRWPGNYGQGIYANNNKGIKELFKSHNKKFNFSHSEFSINNDYFLKKSMETLDNFGIGFSLLSMLIRTQKFINKELANDLSVLFNSMIHSNVFLRPSPTEIVTKYEQILQSHGLLNKYNMRFENHLLVSVDDSVKEPEMPKAIQTFLKELILTCPEGKEINPTSNRCINVCKPGFQRNDKFLCRKTKTQKTQKPKSSKKCPAGKELNPKTNHCNKTCKHGYKRNHAFKCVKDK